LDLEEGHIGKLIGDLGGDGAEVAAASLWAQAMMDWCNCLPLEEFGPEWVRERLPADQMTENNFARTVEGINVGSTRLDTIVRAGAIPPMVSQLRSARGREAENALGALCVVGTEYSGAVVASGALPALGGLLGSSRGRESEFAANLVAITAPYDEVGELMEAIPRIVRQLSSANGSNVTSAARALVALSPRPGVADRIVQAGALSPLVRLLASTNAQVAESALQILVGLGETEAHRQSIVEAGGIEPLVKLLSPPDTNRAGYASVVLLLLADHLENLPRIAATPGAIPSILNAAVECPNIDIAELLDRMRADPALAWAFDQSLVRIRTLLASWEDMDPDQLDVIERWYPALADEIRGYESFDAWKVHVERCDLRRLLLGWRRGVVEVENAASDLEATSLREKMADGTAVVAELPPTNTNTSSSDGGEVAAASGLGLR
jgi:hypothetical protein